MGGWACDRRHFDRKNASLNFWGVGGVWGGHVTAAILKSCPGNASFYEWIRKPFLTMMCLVLIGNLPYQWVFYAMGVSFDRKHGTVGGVSSYI